MSTNDPGQYPPPPWAGQPAYPPPPPPQRTGFAQHKGLTIVLSAVGLLVVLIGIGVAVAVGGDSGGKKEPVAAATEDTTKGTALDPSYTPPPSASPAPEVTATEEAPAAPTARNFTLTAKVTEKDCFGSAGCLVTYKISVAYDGPVLDSSTEWDVTYEVRGPKDGPSVDTLTVTGDEYEVPSENTVTTPSSATKLAVKVTDVSEA